MRRQLRENAGFKIQMCTLREGEKKNAHKKKREAGPHEDSQESLGRGLTWEGVSNIMAPPMSASKRAGGARPQKSGESQNSAIKKGA